MILLYKYTNTCYNFGDSSTFSSTSTTLKNYSVSITKKYYGDTTTFVLLNDENILKGLEPLGFNNKDDNEWILNSSASKHFIED